MLSIYFFTDSTLYVQYNGNEEAMATFCEADKNYGNNSIRFDIQLDYDGQFSGKDSEMVTGYFYYLKAIRETKNCYAWNMFDEMVGRGKIANFFV